MLARISGRLLLDLDIIGGLFMPLVRLIVARPPSGELCSPKPAPSAEMSMRPEPSLPPVLETTGLCLEGSLELGLEEVKPSMESRLKSTELSLRWFMS
jgi:hypothetical protein